MSLVRNCLAVVVVSGVASWAGGCVVSDDDTTPPAPTWAYPDDVSFCAQLATVVCNDEVVDSCYGSSDASRPADKEDCVAAYSALSSCNPYGLPYHPEASEACLAQMQTIWADARVDQTELDAADEDCIGVFYDGRAAGAVCTMDAHCDTPANYRCVIPAGDTEGTCRVPNSVGGGYPCDAIADVCAENFYCNDQSICQVRPGDGTACSEVIPCNSSSLCNEISLLCEAKLANGQACTDAGQCANGFCDKPRNSTDGVCAAAINLAATSASCEPFLP